MMALRLLLSCVLLTPGFSAEISVFVQTGDSVQLEIQTQELPEFDDLSWSNEKSENIVTYTSETKRVRLYKDRVDFNNKSFSLTLKNTQKTDSGLYTAKTSGESNKNIVTYRVSVMDAVEAPVLTVNSNSSSPDPCNFTCNGSNIIISFIYNGSRCSPEEVSSSDNYNLRLNCTCDSITCNYSNPVSWKNDTKKVNEICTVKKGHHEAATVFPLWVLVICLITLASASAVIGFCIYKRKKGTQTNEQTIYAEVDDIIKPQKSLEMLEKSEYPQTVYDTAGDSGQTDVTNHTTPNYDPMSQSGSLTDKSKPMTIYCAIQQQPKPPKTEIDHTIYGVVNKPSAKYESAHPQSE
ncbi:natural killer cell receptor 2B4-like [Carassius auratus]|uniref:Natural killer cell receptor 2B4-like n=1 Tax=Carassius auratus TaxID=7957 RepID=A0A6P6QQ83_CARAU|nr:natural killer cell receptor 2B4-like [Carassius auratus]